MLMARRRATQAELDQGMQEMQQAQRRMEREAAEGGEQAIQDGPVNAIEGGSGQQQLQDGPVAVVNSQTSPNGNTLMVTPQTMPVTPPPSYPPPTQPPESSREVQEVSATRSAITPGVQSGGVAQSEQVQQSGGAQETGGDQTPLTTNRPLEFAEVTTPLFNAAQLQQFAQIYQQAPWLYSNFPNFGDRSQPVNIPVLQRPEFLPKEDSRAVIDREHQINQLQQHLRQDQREREDIKAALQKILEENDTLKRKIQSLEAEGRFATPEGSERQGTGVAAAAVAAPQNLEARFNQEAERPPQEEGPAGRQAQQEEGPAGRQAQQEEGPAGRQAQQEEGPAGRQVPQEEGPAGQKGTQEAERPPQEEGPAGQQVPRSNEDFAMKSMEFMMVMMDSVRDLQKKIGEGRSADDGTIMGVETVRSGSPDLPILQPWHAANGPLMLGDWMLLIEPIVSDLSTSAQEWWKLIRQEVEAWYQVHMSLSPLDRLRHEPNTPSTVSQLKWERLERRVATMMLAAIPESCREELVSSRRLGSFGVLTYLHCVYCPGGVTERQNLLRSLEDPAEAPSLQEAPMSLRKWMRWRRRAKEVGAIEPDPALLLKGLNKLSKKVLEMNRDAQFRVSLVRNSLGVDTTPTSTTVDQLACHLLAEFEQLMMSEKRSGGQPKKEADPKLKSLEQDQQAEKGKGKGKDRERGDEERQRAKCRYYMTEGG